ncbi:MAG TPA: hypothetical protein VHP37_26465 [Burkholderiales bacterium]|jgi:hypothetical protein|nr:hypothetical protein [Burkholderiales bacterium]
MNQSHDFVERSLEVRNLIATSDLAAAIRKAMDLVKDFSGREDLDEVTVYSMTLREIEGAHRREELKFDEVVDRKKKLARQVLGLLGAIESQLLEPAAA